MSVTGHRTPQEASLREETGVGGTEKDRKVEEEEKAQNLILFDCYKWIRIKWLTVVFLFIKAWINVWPLESQKVPLLEFNSLT